MKKIYKIIAILVIFGLLIGNCIYFYKQIAFADALTASAIGAATYSILADSGLAITAGNATANGTNLWMTDNVTEYVNQRGGSIESLFGSQIAIDISGKMVIGQLTYNGIVDFIDWIGENYDLSSTGILSAGYLNDCYVNPNDSGTVKGRIDTSAAQQGFSVVVPTKPATSSNINFEIYLNGTKTQIVNTSNSNWYNKTDYMAEYSLYTDVNNVDIYIRCKGICNGFSNTRTAKVKNVSMNDVSNKISYDGADFVSPVVLNPNKEWVGDFGADPDTNLDQLVGQIYQDVADNNLVVDGEVIDVPIPPPTPEPIAPDTPLSDVPWEGLDNNLNDLYNQGLEEIGAIGDAQDAITDAVGVQTGALEDAIAGNAGVVSGAIDQAVSDIQDAIGDQTAALDQSMSATAEATESIADALEDETINWQRFDLRGLFPFCIPFDIYNMLEALDASPTAPHVQLPFVIESIGFSYTIDLDFSSFDQVASVMRTMELIVYGIALAWATSKVIKW